MNFSSGLILTQMATADSLMELLTNSDKTAKTLKELKQEQAKLSKLKKEVLEGKTLAAYKKKVEGELDELVVKQLDRQQASVDKQKEYANSLKDEYTDKLVDIKERLRGL